MNDYEFGELPPRIQQAIARGDVTLEELVQKVEQMTDFELCP
jgi:hypothetical protein